MALFTFTDAKTALAARLGHRSDITDPQLQKWLDQAQFIIATNIPADETFDRVSALIPLTIGQTSYNLVSSFSLPKLWAISHLRNETDGLYMRRGVLEHYLSYHTVPSGTPTMWTRTSALFYIFQAPTKDTNVTFYYRSIPDPGVYGCGDDWFDALVQLAQYYAVADIGKGQIRADIKAGLPAAVQLAITTPLSASMWEAIHDSQQGVYPGRY